MNDLISLEFNGASVRVVTIDDEPWWLAIDVASCLGLTHGREAVRQLDDDERRTVRITDGGPERLVINEGGLYSLILRSRKPEAKLFKRWVTHEVLPEIRRRGLYRVDDQPREVQIAEALITAGKMLDEYRQKARERDMIAATGGTFALSDTAKKLGWGPIRFCERLRDDGILFYRTQGTRLVNVPMQRYIDRGWFVVRTIATDPLRQQTRVTGKGELELARRYGSEFREEVV